ncbi:MAG: 50S ribosomal protein L29 [Candidatus Peribacteria bacterium]|jgi:ribosomal protein L29|nr:50S ribosomal protein L29 [Candidatus Peribacteria bacterium]
MKEVKDLKIKSLQTLKEMEEKAIKKEYKVSSEELFVLKMKKELGEQKQTHLTKILRKYIAQIKTIANLKGINI